MNKEQIRELADKIIADYKEHYDFPTQGESHMHDCIVGDLEEFAQLEKAPEPVAWIERRFANGELVLETVKLQKMPDDLRKSLEIHYELDITPLYAYPSCVIALQKQVQALQAENEKLRANPELDLFKRYLKESDEALLFDERLKGKV